MFKVYMKYACYVVQHCRSPTFMTTVPFFDTIKFNPITRLKLYVSSVKEVMTNTVILIVLSFCTVLFLFSFLLLSDTVDYHVFCVFFYRLFMWALRYSLFETLLMHQIRDYS